MDEQNMPFPKKAERAFEWNFNTLLQLLTIVVMLGGGWTVWVNLRRDVIELQGWRAELESDLKDRRGAVEGSIARLGTQAGSLDDRLDQQEAMTIRLSDRLSANEARSQEFAQTLRELQASINEQSGDLKVIRSWIERQERNAQRRQP